MAARKRLRSVAAVAVLGLAGVLAVTGFGTQRSPTRGDARALPAARAGVTAAASGWDKAVTLRGQTVPPSAISCSSPGNCTADGPGDKGYVVSQVRGKWGSPEVIPGTARTRHPSASPGDIVCFSGGCVVVGSYTDTAGHSQAFIVSQAHGTWGKLIWVPGLARLDLGHNASLGQLWCPSAGNCTAAGSYTDAKGAGHPFVVAEVHGSWGSAVQVPLPTGLPGQLGGTTAGLGPISCPAPGDCSATGSYTVNGGDQLYVISLADGTWGSAIPLPESAAQNTGLEAFVNAISCPSPGNCAAGGYYWTSTQFQDAFVANEVNGTWQDAIIVPGTSDNSDAWISSISCPSANNCGAGGIDDYENTERPFGSVFVVNEVRGVWQNALPIPGTNALNIGDDASVSAISCTNAWNCGLGGYYTPGNAEPYPYWEAFVVSEVHGTWSTAIEVQGTGTENTAINASTTVISCVAPSLSCAAGGYFDNNNTGYHAFVVSKP
jgi:hypothetical protein